MIIEKVKDDFITPADDDYKENLGDKSADELLEALAVFKTFEHPYDGLFVPTIRLRNSDTVYTVTAEGGKLSCMNVSDPNQSFVDISPEEIVNLTFEVPDLVERDDEPPKKVETEIVPIRRFYWLYIFIVLVNVCIMVACSVIAYRVWNYEPDFVGQYIFEPIYDANTQILLKRRASGIFYSDRFTGSEVIVLKRAELAEFYLITQGIERGAMRVELLERRPFTLADVGNQPVLKIEGMAPLFSTGKNVFVFHNRQYKRFEGDWDSFLAGSESMDRLHFFKEKPPPIPAAPKAP